jgi:hypothetical protein
MRDDTHPISTTAPADPDDDDTDDVADEARAAELSRAAREAVRGPADPRIDRQLARMGLAPAEDDADAIPSRVDRQAGRPVRAEELEAVRATLTATQAGLDRTRGRVDLLTWVVTLEGIAIAILALLLLLR